MIPNLPPTHDLAQGPEIEDDENIVPDHGRYLGTDKRKGAENTLFQVHRSLTTMRNVIARKTGARRKMGKGAKVKSDEKRKGAKRRKGRKRYK